MKTLKIKSSELADLIECVVLDTVAAHKKEWIAEQEVKNNALIESKVKAIASKILKESKK